VQTPEAIKRRLETAEDLRSIVRTMKALAVVSIRQYEEAVASLREYARCVDLGLQALLQARPSALLTLRREPARRPGIIVIGSDQGLCGGFNEQIAAYYLDARAAATATPHGPVLAVGMRVAGRLEEAGVALEDVLLLPASSGLIAAIVQDLLVRIDRWRAGGAADGVLVYFNRIQPGVTYRSHQETLLPLDAVRLRTLAATPWRPRATPMVAGDWDALFSAVVRQHLFVTLHQAIAESLAAENASRLAAMHAAERNIDERLAALRGQFHRQRQTGITTELLDIVSGYETLTAADLHTEDLAATDPRLGWPRHAST
jgi:F-type H+-transporting ATPase subunit gamma